MAAPAPDITLRNALPWRGSPGGLVDIGLRGDRVLAVHPAQQAPRGERELDLEGRLVLPGLLNGHDHLDLAVLPALGRPPHADADAWNRAVQAALAEARPGELPELPPADVLFLGGLRNLLSGVTAVAHHGAWHRSLGRPDFPVHVLERYQFARHLGAAAELRRTYRSTDRRIPWFVHAAEGGDGVVEADLQRLAEANLLRQNTVLVGGIGLRDEDAPRLAVARAAVVWCPEADALRYGRSSDPLRLRGAGVVVGLGSESALTGARDLLSSLAAARASGLAGDTALELATEGSAAAARLPLGALQPGARADLLVAASAEALVSGDRRTVELVVVAGRPRYGSPRLMDAAGVPAQGVRVDGADKALDRAVARRAASLLARLRSRRRAAWLEGVSFAREVPLAGAAPRARSLV